MKIILATFGSYGDIQPFLCMGRELRSYGHEILFIANPFFANTVEQEGFEFRPAGTVGDYHTAATPATVTGKRLKDQNERIAVSRRLFTNMFLNPVQETYQIISENRTDDTIILGHSFAYGARLAAEKYGIPFINICLSTYWLKGFVKPASFSARMQRLSFASTTRFIDGQLFTKPINILRAEIGLGPMVMSSNRWMFDGPNLCLLPPWMLDFKLEDGIHATFAGFPVWQQGSDSLPEKVAEFLQKHDMPIVFTPGSSTSNTESFFTEALAALQMLKRPGILLSRSHAGIPEHLPDNVIHEEFVPLYPLLGKCSILVHPGGIGTAAQAMAKGIPQLICPRTDEQRENARVLKSMGVCEVLPFGSLEHGTMAQLLEKLSGSPDVQQACKAISEKPLQLTAEFLNNYVCECGRSEAKATRECQPA